MDFDQLLESMDKIELDKSYVEQEPKVVVPKEKPASMRYYEHKKQL